MHIPSHFSGEARPARQQPGVAVRLNEGSDLVSAARQRRYRRRAADGAVIVQIEVPLPLAEALREMRLLHPDFMDSRKHVAEALYKMIEATTGVTRNDTPLEKALPSPPN